MFGVVKHKKPKKLGDLVPTFPGEESKRKGDFKEMSGLSLRGHGVIAMAKKQLRTKYYLYHKMYISLSGIFFSFRIAEPAQRKRINQERWPRIEQQMLTV